MTAPDLHALGANVMAARIKLKLTPEQLAADANVHPRVVHAVEDGRGCTDAEAFRLSEALQVPLEQLLHGRVVAV